MSLSPLALAMVVAPPVSSLTAPVINPFGLPPPTLSSTSSISSKVTTPALVFALFAGGFLVVATVTAVFLFCLRDVRHSKRKGDKFTIPCISGAATEFSYKDLATATRFFSQKLGEGGFGVVYKGLLPQGEEIAVKVLDSSRNSDKQFINEVSSLGTIHHVNLVRLLGFCVQDSKRILVYEYVRNGCLDRYLVPSHRGPVLSWKERYSIAWGTARGLAYLHEDCRSRIIHCDIKPENILLDDGLLPKIADFGLVKMYNRDGSEAVTTMRGTPGYVAPECWSLGKGIITHKFDVYNFGMVLLEIIGGRRNFSATEIKSSRLYFPEWAFHRAEEGDFAGIVDSRIRSDADGEEVRRLMLVALWFIQEDASSRPSMNQVLQFIEGTLAPPPNPPSPFSTSILVPKHSTNMSSSSL